MMENKSVKKVVEKSIFDDEDILVLFAYALGRMKLWATPAQIKYIRKSKILEELKLKYLNG